MEINDKLKLMKNDKLEMYRFDEAELQKVFEALDKDSNEKMKIFFLLSATTGLRANQVLSLKFDDIDERASTLSITTSTQNTDEQNKLEVAIKPSVLTVLKKEKELNPTDTYIFESKKSNNVINQKSITLSRQAVNRAFSKANMSTGSSITPRELRQMYREKFLASVKNQAGHFLPKK
tara:strand:- start:278 stop:811 length:534 start_codon:yes stop_codon:yes gene_type:complete